jgi:LacI family transcriptional regulator
MPATLNDVAYAAGVSNVTASRVLTSKQSAVPISEATCRHVLDAAAHLSYRPNLLARGSRTQRSGAVAVMVEDIADPVFAALIAEVDTVLKERGYHLLLSHAALDSHSARTYDRVLGSSVDGLLVPGDRVLARDHEEELLAHHRHVLAIARARTGRGDSPDRPRSDARA